MATFNSDVYGASAGTGASTNNSHGVTKVSTHLHATCAVTAALTTGDVLNMGYLPGNAVVTGVILKAQSQIDSSTGLALSVGISGTGTLWMSSITTVGRATGVTSASAIATTGGLYKTTGKTLVIVTATTGPTTGVAGNIEVDIEYYVEEAAGSQA